MKYTSIINKILFILIVTSAVILFAACKNKGKATTAEHAHKKELWTCPMHPEIIRDKPGTCPVCGMDLIKKEEDATVLTGIKLDDLLQPTDRFVVSSIPVTTVRKKVVSMEMEAFGTITYDTRLINTIAARVSGRIEKLYVRYRYQHIHKGDHIMDIYSPELVTAEQELLFLVKNDPDNASLISAAKQKLILLGVSENQLQQVIQSQKPSLTIAVYSNYTGHIHEAGNTMPGMNNPAEKMDISRVTEELPVKEGMYVQKGQTIFQLFNTDKSWVLLDIFPEQQGMIKTGNMVRIVPETAPEKNFRAKIDFIEPFYREENKTLTARVYFDNSNIQIPIGSQVRATIFGNKTPANWLPKDAVLSLGFDKVTFIKTAGGFKAHKIETGMIYKNMVQVLSGLNETDSVAANAQFLTDSESFIKVNN
jgi:Cu(I)/Ag(I) efflux system membrane fusion protein